MTLSLTRPEFCRSAPRKQAPNCADCQYRPTSGVGKESCSPGLGKYDEGPFSAEAVCSREIGLATGIQRICRSSREAVWHRVAFRFFIADGSETGSRSNFLRMGHSWFLVHSLIQCPRRPNPGLGVYVEIINATSTRSDGRSDDSNTSFLDDSNCLEWRETKRSPNHSKPERGQVNVLLQLFVRFARQARPVA
jgi:hypothetical protein